MKKVDLAMADKIISNQLYLLRFTAGEVKKVEVVLTQMQKELTAKLSTGLTDFAKARVNALLKKTTAIIDTYYSDLQTQLDLTGIAKHEATANTGAMTSIGLDASMPTAAVLKAMISETLLSGAPLAAWWKKQSDDLAFRFASSVRQGVAQGETLQEIITRVFGSKKLGTPGIGFPVETLRRNASTLVHDSIMQISNDAKLATYQENSDVLNGVQQLSTLDSKTSEICIAYSGAQWDLEGNPINGTTLPFDGGCPRHPNCLPGNTVISAAGISKHYKRWFDGEVIVLSIAGIDDVTLTPNHPVLTDHGWIKAGLLKKGDNLVSCEDVEAAMFMLNPNNHHMETRIEDIGDSLLMSGGVAAPSMPTTPEDFHGDGTTDDKVRIILANGLLANNGQPGINEQSGKGALSSGDGGRVILDTDSAVAKFLISGLTSSPDGLSGDSAGGSCRRTGAGGLNDIGLTDRTDRQSETLKSSPNKPVSTSDSLCNIASGFAGYIGFVKLKDVTIRKYCSHVYNLQSDFGWYVANIAQPQKKSKGIIVHNCRSVLVPIAKTFRELGIDVDEVKGTRASDLGQIPGDTSFDAFLKRHDAEYVDELLGKGKAALYRSGKITLRDLVSGSGRPLTLTQLQAGL